MTAKEIPGLWFDGNDYRREDNDEVVEMQDGESPVSVPGVVLGKITEPTDEEAKPENYATFLGPALGPSVTRIHVTFDITVRSE